MSGNQPPPRKGAYTKHIAALHKDQYVRIQAKNAQELELLDDIHAYMKKRAMIEKNYGESLLKLTTQFQSHKILNWVIAVMVITCMKSFNMIF